MDIFFDRRNIYATSEIKLLLKTEERREKEKGKGITTNQSVSISSDRKEKSSMKL